MVELSHILKCTQIIRYLIMISNVRCNFGLNFGCTFDFLIQWRLMNSHGTATILVQHVNKLYYPPNLSYKPHLLQPHLHPRLGTWPQWIEQRQMQDETRNIYALGFSIRGLTVMDWAIEHWIYAVKPLKFAHYFSAHLILVCRILVTYTCSRNGVINRTQVFIHLYFKKMQFKMQFKRCNMNVSNHQQLDCLFRRPVGTDIK